MGRIETKHCTANPHGALGSLIEAYAQIESAKLELARARSAGQIGIRSERLLAHIELELVAAGLGVTELQLRCRAAGEGREL